MLLILINLAVAIEHGCTHKGLLRLLRNL